MSSILQSSPISMPEPGRSVRLRRAVRQFTPNWFACTMGTGILALALGQMDGAWKVSALGEVLWLFNIALFALCTMLYLCRWILFTRDALEDFSDPVRSMFCGCIPMGLATVLNGFLLFGVPRWGHVAVEVAELLWWVDVVLSAVCGIVVPFLMFTRQVHRFEDMTAVWLLPVVAAEVAAVSGGLLVPHLIEPMQQLSVLFISYMLWALSVPLALGILVVLFLRMVIHKLPQANMAATCWLALGPIGTGALGMLVLGAAAPDVMNVAGLGALAAGIGSASVLCGVLLWAYGLWWLTIALLITLRYLRSGLPFNLGWWGYTFPLGVYAVATFRLAHIIPLQGIAVLSFCLAGVLATVWIIVATRTVHAIWKGQLL